MQLQKIVFRIKIIQMNLFHSWMNWTNYDLQEEITKVESKYDFN
jgi:hypothetical protein